VLYVAGSEEEAGAIQAVLSDVGIDSRTTTEDSMLGIWGAWGGNKTAIVVRRSDLERGAEAIAHVRSASVDLDWDEVDVGEPVDRLAARIAGRDPKRLKRRRLYQRTVLILLAVFGILLLWSLIGNSCMLINWHPDWIFIGS